MVNPPFPLMTTEELDAAFDLPYTRLPHPKYKGKTIPAYEMIKFSVNLHRGCFGGCSFCTISAHQGKFVVCRSKESILKEVKKSSRCLIQGLSERFGRSFCQHVRNARQESESLRSVQASVVCKPSDLSEPQYRPQQASGDLSCCRCFAGNQEEFHW